MKPTVGVAAMLMVVGCGGGSLSMDGAMPPDGSIAGTCGVGVPAGQACNALDDLGAPVTPTCTTGTMPVGTGGTILDGTYVLTAQTYYNVSACSGTPVSGTVVFTGNCVQTISEVPITATSAGPFTVQGNVISDTFACINVVGIDAGELSLDAPGKTFTATATTFTLFTANAAAGNPNPDRIEAYTRR